jgi:hypothetical protein
MENPTSGGPFDRPLANSSDSHSDSRPSNADGEPTAAAQDLVADPSLTAASSLPTGFAAGIQDPFEDLDFFTRKDIMKMAFESGVRFYQQLAIKDQKLASGEKLQPSMELCLDHMVMNLSMYLNDTTMGLAFARAEQQLSHQEDPWTLAILRERHRAALMAAAMGGP